MAKFTAGPGAVDGIDFTQFDIKDIVRDDAGVEFAPSAAAATQITFFETKDSFDTFRGKFVISAPGGKFDDVLSGTINEIEQFDNSVRSSLLSGLSMSVAQFETFLSAGNSQGFLAAVFASADTITGSDKADNMQGFAGNDTIDGAGGNDTLGGDAGNDSLIGGVGDDAMDGGAGNDTYAVDSTLDKAAETGVGAAGGTDIVLSSAAAYALGANIENLTLVEGAGSIDGTGNTGANVLTGNSGDNELSGDAGKDKLLGSGGGDTLSGGADNDTLDGGIGNDSLDGGAGDDSMAGGADDDAYAVDSLKDKVTESLTNDKGGGEDSVRSTVTFTLGNNVDNLVLLDSATPINGTGNALDNTLSGNKDANKLSGLAGADTLAGNGGNDTLDGGAGIDDMAGGEGDDSYVLDVAGDVVTEAAAAGTDTVLAPFAIDLNAAAFKNIENATLLGTAALSAKGTDDNNLLAGNSGNNTLEGLGGNDTLEGGKGSDILKGGTGNDVYGIDSAKDVVDETAGDDDDKIRSSITVDLANYANIENVELVGTGAINATGTDLVNNTLTGNAGTNKLDGLTGDDTMDGRGGNDTYFVDSSNDKVAEDTVTGGGIDTVISQASFELGDNIENLTLLGAALTGTGNEIKNTITGNDQANTLDGGGDIDKLVGGKGNDTYVVDNSKDVVTESLASDKGGGVDLVQSSADFVLGANVDNLQLTGDKNAKGTGNALANEIIGNDFDNALSGLAGNDTLSGGAGNDTVDGGTGIDKLTGGTGNDTYVLDSALDTFVELDGDLSDTVAATFNIDLTDVIYDNIENATLLGSAKLNAAGDADNNILTGNSGVNTLTGDKGNDTLDGGKGVDSLVGGEGNDVYVADNAGEKIVDSNGDADEVRSTVTFTLAALAGIENLTLLGAAALNGTGNGGDNAITGNTGNNKLDGGAGDDEVNGEAGNDTLTGGDGNDTLKGGKGNDIYVVDSGDTVVEAADEGTDTVQSAITVSIAAFANVENLTLTGTGNVGGTGNGGNNIMTGNSGNNALDGGAGADTMVGGKGNDTYTIDDGKDVVTEAASAGTDTVLTSLGGYALPTNVENLTLTGSGNIGGTGNTLANVITGNDGDNVLNGLTGNDTLGGGSGGEDTLNGGAGTDTYQYTAGNGPDVVNTGDNGLDRVSLTGDPYDWDVQRDGDDLLIQFIADEASVDDDFDPSQSIRIVDQYAGAGIAFFMGDFGEFNKFYGGNPDLTTVFTPSGLTGKDQGANAEVVEGTSLDDTINGGGGQSDFLYGNDGNDVINSQSDTKEFAFLYGGAGNDTLNGAIGSDNLRGNDGDDVLNGGAGRDRADYRFANGAVTVDLNIQGTAQTIGADQGKDTLIDIENARGGAFNDTLIGNDIGNTLSGRAGDDSLTGGAGGDFLIGGKGNDTLDGGALDDFDEASFEDADLGVIVNLSDAIIPGAGPHSATDGLGGVDTLINIAGVFGSEFGDLFFGADTDEFFEPMGGDDMIEGNGGFDEVDYLSSLDGVTANLGFVGSQAISASQGKDFFIEIEGLSGSAFNDTLTGDQNGNFLGGRDGADSLLGAAGDDRLRGGAGNDTLNGGFGFDEADYIAATAGVRVDLSKQGVLQVISASEGSDFLIDIEDARGSDFNDTLIGNSSFNTLDGSDGNDSLLGGDEFDFLFGGAGNDTLNGGPAGDFDEVSYFDSTGSVIANLSTTTQFGTAAGTVQDGLGGVDKLINISGVLGSAFADTMIGESGSEFFEGHTGNDSLAGGLNFDGLEYINSEDGVTVSLLQQGIGQTISASQGTDTITGMEDIFGSQFADKLTGDGGENFIFGRGGDDTLTSNGGTDRLGGGAGDDQLVVANTAFRDLSGGDGVDRLVVTGSGISFTQQIVFNKLFDLEEIDLTGSGNNSLTLNALDVLQTSDTLEMRVLGNAGDQVTSIAQGWTKEAGTQSFEGQDYNVYTTNVAGKEVTLFVDTDITQFNIT